MHQIIVILRFRIHLHYIFISIFQYNVVKANIMRSWRPFTKSTCVFFWIVSKVSTVINDLDLMLRDLNADTPFLPITKNCTLLKIWFIYNLVLLYFAIPGSFQSNDKKEKIEGNGKKYSISNKNQRKLINLKGLLHFCTTFDLQT